MHQAIEFSSPESASPAAPSVTQAPAEQKHPRLRIPGPYICRSGPRHSRYAAMRESCASFRLAASLREAKERPVTA